MRRGFFYRTGFWKGKINVGLDLFNNKRVEEAKKENVYKKISLYDGDTIPYPDNYFNTIVSNCVLEHIPDVKSSLKEIQRVLKPGGFFITSVMADQWEDNLLGLNCLVMVIKIYEKNSISSQFVFSGKNGKSILKTLVLTFSLPTDTSIKKRFLS